MSCFQEFRVVLPFDSDRCGRGRAIPFALQSVEIYLQGEIVISGGDVIVKNDALPILTQELEVLLHCMDYKPF
ncbi:MAG: hypothetical protein ABI045_07020 [Flavobacteriales bacterium]